MAPVPPITLPAIAIAFAVVAAVIAAVMVIDLSPQRCGCVQIVIVIVAVSVTHVVVLWSAVVSFVALLLSLGLTNGYVELELGPLKQP